MVNLETRKIVDMIESREMEDVTQWLSTYPNIQVVSRDGSLTYAAAITAAHPKAMQISDRFHLVKNLCDHARVALHKILKGRIAIPITSETKRARMEMLMGTVAEKVRLVQKLHRNGHSKAEISLMTGASAPAVRQYVAMREADIPPERQTVRGREHEQAVQKLLERAEQVRILRGEGYSITEICQRTGFTAGVVRNCLSDGFSPVNAHYGRQREGKLAPYRDEVLRLRLEGFTYYKIHQHIQQKGYSGTEDAIRGFISKEKRVRRDLQALVGEDMSEFIDRKWLVQLLYKPIEKVKGLSPNQLEAVMAAYPLAGHIIGIVEEFKAVLKSKNPQFLPRWIEKALSLKIVEIGPFINGMKKDIDAVMNAISSDFSNGLAEGSVNKIKVVKRIMYGRCHFPILKNKCLLMQTSY